MRPDFAKLRGDITQFVETGYGSGDGVCAALEAGFDSVTSIEIVPDVAEQANHEWLDADDRVVVLSVNSYDGLSMVCQRTQGPIFFWLDAYTPAAYGYTKRADQFNAPLEYELEIIAGCRDVSEDVICIGGLSLYERGCEQPIDAWKWLGKTDSKFIERIFGATHTIERHTQGAGYAILTPKRHVSEGTREDGKDDGANPSGTPAESSGEAVKEARPSRS